MRPDTLEINFEKISTARRGLPGHGSDINRWADECQDKYKREVRPKWRKPPTKCVEPLKKVDPAKIYEINCGEVTLPGHQSQKKYSL
ncbi:MAG: hypothetical protein Q8Q24_00045 [bacterium]|nr:hypothetical protein [bacterium]